MDSKHRVFITGGSGLLGNALVTVLRDLGFSALMAPSSKELNLLSFEDTRKALAEYKPDYVFHLAGAVYGLGGNLRNPGNIYLQNTLMNTHVVEAARQAGVRKIVAMGSICAYPTPPLEPGPLRETALFFGEPHGDERAYGQSKRAMLAQLEAYEKGGLDYAFAISTNLYGPWDHFNLETGHVVPSLVRKFYEASVSDEEVVLWGDGLSKRDILHSRDAARGLISIVKHARGRVNLATGRMLAIREIAEILGDISGVGRRYRFDTSKPKGHEFAGINIDRLKATGFEPSFTAQTGLADVYRWYAENSLSARK